MSLILLMQATYTAIELGCVKDYELVAQHTIDKHMASAQLLMAINTMLEQQHTTSSGLSFIAASCGPAPFTSLRTMLTTSNGVAYAGSIPLLGLDGMRLFLHEYQESKYPYTVALFNAYNKELYYGIASGSTVLQTGYGSWKQVQEIINVHVPINEKIQFIGNGVELARVQIEQSFSEQLYIPLNNPHANSLLFLSSYVLGQKNIQQEFVDQLFPMYLKSVF